ncbi:MAG: phenylalanine-4-hydroxylase [Betaproteobacteria bacterium]|jgi:phenylalanine-4-hydroxylase|nr:phenylalanine-4-hydroxylase [Betaproteobacteria bacterium]
MSLRGDYARASADYAVAQDWARYSLEEHSLYRRLFERQAKLVPKYACPEWIKAIAALDSSREIPKFDDVSRKLKKATGWEIVAVPGLIPDEAFFTHLASRRFPVTVWLRRPEEFDYIVEPDVFHDFFGHVPLLFDRVYADHLHEYGKGGLKAMRLDAVKMLARLYWYTIEFGLMKTPQGVRAYGAGLLSSGGELAYCIDDPRPQRLPFDLERMMRTDYEIDRYQQRYFVIDSFEQLMRETAPDFTPIYARLRS